MQLPEQLAQIDHIFSDKTGTLTRNELVFRGLTFDGHLCEGQEVSEIIEKVKNSGSAVASVLFDCFCLCNDCYFVDNEEKGKRDLQGPSQDELILLELAAQSQIRTLEDRSKNTISVRNGTTNAIKEYRILRNIRFDSVRRMMSMVVEDPETKDVYVFSKGADSAILPLIRDQETDVYRTTEAHMESFAENGMRTLVFAYKKLEKYN